MEIYYFHCYTVQWCNAIEAKCLLGFIHIHSHKDRLTINNMHTALFCGFVLLHILLSSTAGIQWDLFFISV